MIRKILDTIAQNIILFEVFERIFGADKQKKIIYRRAYNNDFRLLDFGCSTGNTTEAFLDFQYTGIDLDANCIRYAKKRWRGFSNVKFICADILDKPLGAKYFDYVLFAGTGHHISDEQIIPIIKELTCVLKKRGEIWFYDILKPDKHSRNFTKILAKLDRGRYIRTMLQYHKIFGKVHNLEISESKIIKVDDTLFPQEDYGFFRLKRKIN